MALPKFVYIIVKGDAFKSDVSHSLSVGKMYFPPGNIDRTSMHPEENGAVKNSEDR